MSGSDIIGEIPGSTKNIVLYMTSQWTSLRINAALHTRLEV
jgi:hypothetical protein